MNKALAVPKLVSLTKWIPKNAQRDALSIIIIFRAIVIGPRDEITIIKKSGFHIGPLVSIYRLDCPGFDLDQPKLNRIKSVGSAQGDCCFGRKDFRTRTPSPFPLRSRIRAGAAILSDAEIDGTLR